MELEVNVDVAKVEKLLTRLSGELLKWDDTMAAVGAAFKKYFGTMPFVSKGTIFGEQWPALQLAYRSWKAKKFPGKPLMIRSGDLAKGFDFISTTNMVKVFNKTDYFEKHQKGEGVPKRVTMAINNEVKSAGVDIFRNDLQKKINAL